VTEDSRVVLGCLALNASFEPLTMVPVKRALRLVIDGKAEIVEADQGRLRQVLHNLLQNARRYAGGNVTIGAHLQDECVVLRVEDDGPGIPPDERQTIFSRGLRGITAGTEPGSGLGLYISAKLMHAQGGELTVEDSASGGACFVVVLPGFSELSTEALSDNLIDQSEEGDGLVPVDDETVVLFTPRRDRAPGRVEHENGVRDEVAR
jgi:signal transduction histidine kinase